MHVQEPLVVCEMTGSVATKQPLHSDSLDCRQLSGVDMTCACCSDTDHSQSSSVQRCFFVCHQHMLS